MNDKNSKNNNIMKAAVYRGWSKAKIEDIVKKLDGHDTCLKKIEDSIGEIKQYMAANNAVGKLKNGLFGFLGGLLPVIAYAILHLTGVI